MCFYFSPDSVCYLKQIRATVNDTLSYSNYNASDNTFRKYYFVFYRIRQCMLRCLNLEIFYVVFPSILGSKIPFYFKEL